MPVKWGMTVSKIVEISTRRTFEAAHTLPMLPDSHKCSRMHGHNYMIEIVARGELDPVLGWVCDYGVLDCAIDELIIKLCDHRYLNDIAGLENPTGENIAIWALERLRKTVFPIVEVSVWETPHYKATARA